MDSDFAVNLHDRREETEVLRNLMGYAVGIMEAANATTQLITPDFHYLEVVGQLGFSSAFEDYFRRLECDAGTICGRAFLERMPIVVEDALKDAASYSHRHVFEEANVRGVVSVPVITRGGAFYGMVSTHRQKPHRPTELQMTKLVSAAHAAADAIVSIRARRRTLKRSVSKAGA